MQVIEYSHELHVKIPFNRFRAQNANTIKLIKGSRWDWAKNAFVVSIQHREYLISLKNNAKPYNPIEWINVSAMKEEELREIKPLPELTYDYKLKQGNLRDYQKTGVARGLELKRYINGDEQRLGKTIQTIATLCIAQEIKKEQTFPCLVICPATLKLNWKDEWEMWTDKKVMILDDRIKDTWHRFYEMGMADVFVVNYQSLKKHFVDYMPPKNKMKDSNDIRMNERIKLFKSVIIDESHRLKDPSSQQTKISLQICLRKDWIVLLSGTPVKNKPIDLFPQLAIMGRLKEFGGTKGFKGRYCEGGSGFSNLKELNVLLNEKCFFRRERKEVLKDLPPKQRQTILCDITTRDRYENAKNNFVQFLKENGATDIEIASKIKGEIMVKMQELKKISALGKINEVKDYIDDVIDSGEKIVIFCVLHAIVDELLKHYPKALLITGRQTEAQKDEAKNKFQQCKKCKKKLEHHGDEDHEYVNNEHQLIICNIQSAGVGLNLSASSIVGFIEYPWTSADSFQCEDRIFDVKKHKPINCVYFLGSQTIDEQNFELIQSKAGLSNAITGSTDLMQTEFISKFLNSVK